MLEALAALLINVLLPNASRIANPQLAHLELMILDLAGIPSSKSGLLRKNDASRTGCPLRSSRFVHRRLFVKPIEAETMAVSRENKGWNSQGGDNGCGSI